MTSTFTIRRKRGSLQLTKWMTALLAMLMAGNIQAAEKKEKPNILLIISDQHHEAVMSNAGCRWVKTPGMDRLAANGVRFPNSYVSLPVCLPQRFCMFSGLLPHHRKIQDSITDRTVGNLMKEAGYETAYFGKWHISGYEDKTKVKLHGFSSVASGKDETTVEKCAAFLKGKHDKPFFAVASFYNPHDICEWGRKKSGYKQRITMKNGAQPIIDPPLKECPPLPKNFSIAADEAGVIQARREEGSAQKMASEWMEKDWRQYRWAYAQLVQEVDKHILKLQKTLDERGLDENTVLIYTSDHGDGVGAHRWHQKSTLYEESVRVPFLMQWKGKFPQGTVRKDLMAPGLDLMPTLCALSGASMPNGPYFGKSVVGVMNSPEHGSKSHEFVVSRMDIESATGRMLRSKDYKYMVFSSGENNEQLFDMRADSGETINLAGKPEFRETLEKHRAYFREWLKSSDDDYLKRPTTKRKKKK